MIANSLSPVRPSEKVDASRRDPLPIIGRQSRIGNLSATRAFALHNKGIAAMKIREIPLDDLVLDPNLNLRDRLDDFTVERYADSWDRLPPITVYKIDDRLLVADGFHRHAAAVMLGKRTIRAEIIEGTFTDALDFVASVNLFHGLPLTRAERRRAVEVKLKLHHDWSDRRMAEELAVSRELVAKIRRQLIESRQIPNLPGRVGADGKLYTSAGLPKDANERLPKDQPAAPDDEATERGRRGMGTAAAPWVEPKAETPAGRAPTRTADTGALHSTRGPGMPGPRHLSADVERRHDRRDARPDGQADHAGHRLDPGRGLPGRLSQRQPQCPRSVSYGRHQAGRPRRSTPSRRERRH